MSKTLITADDPYLSHWAGGYILEGEDRVTVRDVYESADDMPMVGKSVRLPLPMIKTIEKLAHPDGFSGIVREALVEWFDRHANPLTQVDEAQQALATLTRVVTQLQQHRAHATTAGDSAA